MKTKTAKPTAPAEPTWEHRGYTITLNEHGTFWTKVNEKHLSGSSLDTLKKKINDLTSIQPEPFTALELDLRLHNGVASKDGIRTVMVRSVEKGARGRYESEGFVGEARPKRLYHSGGAEKFRVLHPDTPECREAYKAYMDALVETARIEEARRKIERALFNKIPRYEIRTFLENGNRLVAEYPD